MGHAAAVAQKTFLVGIENRHEGHFGQVEAFAQEVHAHQHLVDTGAQIFHDLHALQGVDVRVDVGRGDAQAQEVFRQLFGHAFGEGGHQRALVVRDGNANFFEQVVDREIGVAHLDGRIEQTRRANHLVDVHTARFGEFILVGGGADIDDLVGEFAKLFEFERAVVERGGQAETVVHQAFFARAVAAVHGADLWHTDVAFVDDHEKVFREKVEQTIGAHARLAAVEVARIVFDARAVTEFANHFEIIVHAFFETLGFEEFALLFEERHLRHQVVLYLVNGVFLAFFGGHEEVGGIDLVLVERTEAGSRHAVHFFDAIDLVAPEIDAQHIVGVGQKHIDRVAFHTEVAARGRQVVARVERIDEAAQQHAHGDGLPRAQQDDILVERGGIAHAVDATHRRNDHHIFASGEERGGGGESELVQIVVDGQVFLNVGVGRRDVGFGLVVVVVRHVVFHGVVREKALHLGVELGGQGLVVRENEGGAPDFGDDVGDGEGFARAGHAEQHLRFFAGADALGELADGFGLIAHGFVGRGELKCGHGVEFLCGKARGDETACGALTAKLRKSGGVTNAFESRAVRTKINAEASSEKREEIERFPPVFRELLPVFSGRERVVQTQWRGGVSALRPYRQIRGRRFPSRPFRADIFARRLFYSGSVRRPTRGRCSDSASSIAKTGVARAAVGVTVGGRGRAAPYRRRL